MSLGRRLASAVAGRVDALLSRLEDPGEALEVAYQLLLDRLAAARHAVDALADVCARVEVAALELEAAGERLEALAAGAAAAGRRDRAREALARRHVVGEGVRSLRSEGGALVEEERRFAGAVDAAADRARTIGAERAALKLLASAGEDRARLVSAAAAVRADAEEVRLATGRAEAAIAARRAQLHRVEALLASGELEDLTAVPEVLAAELAAARSASAVERSLHDLEGGAHS